MLTKAQVHEKLDTIRRQYFERGDLEETLKRYKSVLNDCEIQGAEEDAFATCCRDIADILYEIGRKEDAFAMYDRALGYNVSDINIKAHTMMNKGLSLLQDGNQTDAEALLKEAYEISTPPLKQIAFYNYQKLLEIGKNRKFEIYFKTQRQVFGK